MTTIQLYLNTSFQSTPSVWRETVEMNQFGRFWKFQSTPSVWRETFFKLISERISFISIHSLRVEGDAV